MNRPIKFLSLIFGLFLGSIILAPACGGGSGDDATGGGGTEEEASGDTISLAVTVGQPVSANLSPPTLTIGKNGLALRGPAMETVAGETFDLTVRDTSGYPVADVTCTTDSTGACTLEGVPADLAQEGIIVVADNGEMVMQALVVPTQEMVEERVLSGEPIIVADNPGTDMTAAIVTAECGGDAGSCSSDLASLVTATDALVSDALTRDNCEDATVCADLATLGEFHERLILELQTDTEPRPKTMLTEAIQEGISIDMEAVVGDTLAEGVLDDTAVTGDAIASAYCDPVDPVLADVRSAAETNGIDPDVAVTIPAMVIGEFEPAELTEIVADLQNLVAITAVPDLVTEGAVNVEVRQGIAELIRLGAMDESEMAVIEQAVGLFGATLSADGNYTTYNPITSAQTAYLFNNQLVNETATRYPAMTLAAVHADAFRDSAFLLSAATGGTRALATYTTNFIAYGTADSNVVPPPPGGTCSSDSDCGYSLCVDGSCTLHSTTINLSCTDSADCTSGEVCVGTRLRGRVCMMANSVPPRAMVFRAGETTPVLMSAATPTSGEAGSSCPCSTGFTCTSTTASVGICLGNGLVFKAPGMMCLASSECVSGVCSTGRCAYATSLFGPRAMGTPCTSHYQCQSAWCSTGGICDMNPSSSNLFTAGGITRVSDGSACSYGWQCSSNYCDMSRGQCSSFTGPTGGTTFTATKTSGQACTFTGECVYPLQCISGICAGYTSAGSSCSASSQCAADQYCSAGNCVAKGAGGATCAATATSTTLEACAAGLGCNPSGYQCQPAVTVSSTLPAPVTNKNAQFWIGTVSQYPSALFYSPVIVANGSQVNATFFNIPPGTYFIGGYVDINGDGLRNGVLNMADHRGFFGGPGSWAASKALSSATAVVPSNSIASFSFPLYTVPRIFVNGTLPASITNKTVRVVVNTVANLNGAPYSAEFNFTGAPVGRQFLEVPAGTYFVAVWVDNDGSGTQTSGDYLKWHNGAGVNPPGAASFTIPEGGDVTANLTAATVP